MLESLVAKVINSYVGRYFENINAHQLSLGLLQGSVQLGDLPLKPSAFNELDLPVRVIAGSVSNFKLSIPISQLKSSPWNVHVDGLYAVLGPKHPKQGSSGFKDQFNKQKALDEIEKTFKDSLKSSAANIDASAYWFDFSSIVANIVNNLQVTVRNIHVRYEDFNQQEKRNFSFGVVLEKLEIRSTDADWNPAFVVSTSNAHKIGHISSISVYLDHDCVCYPETAGKYGLRQYFRESLPKEVGSAAYLVNILKCDAKYFRNLSTQPLKSKTKPRLSLDLTINEVPFEISELQVRTMLFLFNEVERYERSKFFKKELPNVPVIGHAKLWWKFAYRCTVRLLSLPVSVEMTLANIRGIVSYVRLYEKLLRGKVLTPNEKEKQLDFEMTRDFDIIVKLRGIAFGNVAKEYRSEKKLAVDNQSTTSSMDLQNSTSRGWFDWWYGKNVAHSTQAQSSSNFEASNDNSIVNEDEFFNMISDAAADCSLRMVDYLYSHVKISLKSGSLTVKSDKTSVPRKEIVQIKFTHLSYESKNYPRLNGQTFSLGLLDLTVWNKTLNLKCPLVCKREVPEHLRKGLPNLISPALSPNSSFVAVKPDESVDQSSKLFHYSYERSMYRPGVFEHKYILETQPIDVVYDQTIVKMASKLSKLQFKYSSVSRLEKEVYQRYNQIKKQTNSNLKSALAVLMEGSSFQSQDRYSVMVNVSAPMIYLYEDITSSNSHILGIDLGKITFYNEKGKQDKMKDLSRSQMLASELVTNISVNVQEESDDDEFMTPCSTPPTGRTSPVETASRVNSTNNTMYTNASENATFVGFYKRYCLILSDMQIFAGKRSDNWVETFLKHQSGLSLLERLSVNLSLDRCIAPGSSSTEANVIVQGSMSELRLRFSQDKLVCLHNCFSQFSKSKKNQRSSESTSASVDVQEPPLAESEEPKDLPPKQFDEKKLWLLCQFSMPLVSIALHSQDKSLAEFQIYSSSVSFKKFPHHCMFACNIRDALLVDAIQCFGPEFDLLLASGHEMMSHDVKSSSVYGSCDSKPLFTDNVPAMQRVSLFEALETRNKGLIQIQVIKFSKSHSSIKDGSSRISCTGQFSKVEVIANQKTIFELVRFFDNVLAACSIEKGFRAGNAESAGRDSISKISSQGATVDVDLLADQFNLVFILVDSADPTKATKFSTLTFSKLTAKLEKFANNDLLLKAAMGTLVLNRLGSSSPSEFGVQNLPPFRFFMADMHRHESGEPAVSIEYTYRVGYSHGVLKSVTAYNSSLVPENEYSLQINILGAFCLFDPYFFSSLKLCAEEFQTYLWKVKSSLVSIAQALASSSSTEEKLDLAVFIESPVVILQDANFENEVLVCHLGALYLRSNLEDFNVSLTNFKVELKGVNTPSPAKGKNSVSSTQFISHVSKATTLLQIANEISISADMVYNSVDPLKVQVLLESVAVLSLTKHVYKFMKTISHCCKSIMASSNTAAEKRRNTPTRVDSREYSSLFFPNYKEKGETSMWTADESTTESTDYEPDFSGQKVQFLDMNLRANCVKFVLLDYQQCEINCCQVNEFSVRFLKEDSATLSVNHSGIVVTDLFSYNCNSSETTEKCEKIFEFEPTEASVNLATVVLKGSEDPEIDLNLADIRIKFNLQTWVHIFDFFSLGTKAHPSLLANPSVEVSTTKSAEPSKKKRSFHLRAKFSKIELVLAKPTYNIAKAMVVDMSVGFRGTPDLFGLELELGKIAVLDQSPWSKVYSQRLSSTDRENPILVKLTKFDCPDPTLERMCDIEFELKTGKIVYVHTARMLSEINNFFQYLSKMLLMYQFMNASKSGQKMSTLRHGNRIRIDLEIPEVELILPYSYDCREVFVASLRGLSVNNSFTLLDENLQSADKSLVGPNNESYCLGDVMLVRIDRVDIVTATVSKDEAPRYVMKNQLLDEGFALQIQVTRNLDGDNSRLIPDLTIHCDVKSILMSIQDEDIRLFKGMLKYNLGENTSDLSWPSDAIYIQNQQQVATDSLMIWRKLKLTFGLEDTKFRAFKSPGRQSLFAQLSFNDSKVQLVTFSDATIKFELGSSSFLLEDIRCAGDFPTNQKPVKFPNILKPIDSQLQSVPQLQINFSSNRSHKILACILSNVEVLCNLEWLYMFHSLLTTNPSYVPQTIPVEKVELFSTSRVFSSLFKPRGMIAGLGSLVNQTSHGIFNKPSKPTKLEVSVANSVKNDEFKLTLNETQLILMDDVTELDSPAIVVKCSAYFSISPKSSDEVAKLSVREVEILSCIYHAANHTRLSIVEPLNVDVDVRSVEQGLATVTSSSGQKSCQVELTVSPIVTRLSYQDIVLLLSMVQSYKTTALEAASSSSEKVSIDLEKLSFLLEMGYTEEQCRSALIKFNGDPNKASVWLVESSLDQSSDDEKLLDDAGSRRQTNLKIVTFDFTFESMSLFLIDDTKSADLPLLHVNVLTSTGHLSRISKTSEFRTKLYVNSFNVNLSGWESLVEQWEFKICSRVEGIAEPMRVVTIVSDKVLDIAISPATFELISHLNKIKQTGFSRCKNTLKGRPSFSPYLIKNKLGLPISFATSERPLLAKQNKKLPELKFRSLSNDASIQFDFSGKSERRNVTLEPHLEKLLHIQIAGFQNLQPLSVNEVGTYLRTTLSANPKVNMQDRVLIQVGFSKELSKRVITVMSGLEVENLLDIGVVVRFEAADSRRPRQEFPVRSGSVFNVPLEFVYATMLIKPDLPEAKNFPRRSIEWKEVKEPGTTSNFEVACLLSDQRLFRYNACIHSRALVRNPTNVEVVHPSHSVKICPVLVIQNLLPVPFTLEVSHLKDDLHPVRIELQQKATGNVHGIDLSETLKFIVKIQDFRHNHPLIIDSEAVGNGVSLLVKLFDANDRPLSLEARILSTMSGGLKIAIYAAYWLINKTGRPLVFKQVECDWEVPGQTEDNEVGTCSTPIMMSFAAGSLRSLVVRCGIKAKPNQWLSVHWSTDKIYCDYFKPGHGLISVDFSSDGSSRRNPNSSQVTRTCSFSYEVFEGKDDYANTNFIVIRPTYMLYNYTGVELLVRQAGVESREAALDYYRILPDSCTSFQWNADDLSGLLTVKLGDSDDSIWCGGFAIEASATVDLYLRYADGCKPSMIVHVDIVQKSSQHLVYFRNNLLPPQYIIRNDSSVDIQICQSECPREKKKDFTSLVPAKTSLPFCLDLPLHHARLKCNVCQSHPVLIDLDDETETVTMTYETFNMFAFLPPVKGSYLDTKKQLEPTLSKETLVFDVASTGQVVLQHRSIARNDQIWRIMSNGMIRNEGRSKSFDPENAHDVSGKGNVVLDVVSQRRTLSSMSDKSSRSSTADTLLVLCVRQAEKKKPSQIWRIDSQGRLVNESFGKSVCPQELLPNSLLVLQNLNTQNNNSSFKLHKFQLKAGSGKLVTSMSFQGPTRVLVVKDDESKSSPDGIPALHKKPRPKRDISMIEVSLSEGVSFSIMNDTPEELIYMSLKNISSTYVFATDKSSAILELKASFLQIDNQIITCLRTHSVVFRPLMDSDSRTKDGPVFIKLCLEYEPDTEYENCKIIHKFHLSFGQSSVLIVERLLLKLIQFVEQAVWSQSDVILWDPNQIIDANALVPAKTKIFLQEFTVQKFSLVVTAQTSRNLSPDLQLIKSKYKIIMVSFDGAKIAFRAFCTHDIMLSRDMLIHDIIKSYKIALQRQALHILGHVDFLGNPIGFFQDVNSGVRQIDNSPDSVSNFARFVTNSVSKSTSKIAESLSDGIGAWFFDEEDQEQRELFREHYSRGVSSNLCGGVLGLVKGVTDGVKGIALQPYRGFRDGGLTGGFAGAVRGVTGAIAKPSIGVLDFAYFTANAMKYTTSTDSEVVERFRSPRCCSYSKLITAYDEVMAQNQEFLYQLNKFDLNEKLIAFEMVLINPDAMTKMLITSTRILVMHDSSPDPSNVEFELKVESVTGCKVVARPGCQQCVLVIDCQPSNDAYWFGTDGSRRLDCENEEVASRLEVLIDYAICKYKKDSYTFR